MSRASEGAEEAAAVAAYVATRLGVRVERVTALAPGLGRRRFYRVATREAPKRLIARIEVPEDAGIRPAGVAPEPALEPLRAFLETAGLPVPASYASDAERGIDLLEDFGELTLEQRAGEVSAAERRALYAATLAPLPRLQSLRDPGGLPAFARRLDARLLAFKAELFARESLPLALGREPRAAERGAVEQAFAFIASVLAEAPARLAHRDLQSRNVLIRPERNDALPPGRPERNEAALPPDRPERPERAPGPRVGWIDLQGALLAPPEYDAVCLLRDSYVELPDEEVAAAIEALRPALPDAPEAAAFALRFDLLTLTRKGKDHARLLEAARRGVPHVVEHLPATVRALRAAAARRAGEHPSLARLHELVAQLPESPSPGPACAP